MATATVTSKGQITIPVEVRRALGLAPGSRVVFVLREDGAYELVPATASVTAIKGLIAAPAVPVSLDAMNEAIAAGAAGDGSR